MCACVCVGVFVLAEPEVGTENHRRSSSMRVTGTSHRNSVRERSSDDCIIGTHLGMGMFCFFSYNSIEASVNVDHITLAHISYDFSTSIFASCCRIILLLLWSLKQIAMSGLMFTVQ